MVSLKASAIPSIATGVSTRGPSVCLSVTLVHPAKAVGQNAMPFGKDIGAVPCNTVLDRAQFPTGRGDLGFGTLFSDLEIFHF